MVWCMNDLMVSLFGGLDGLVIWMLCWYRCFGGLLICMVWWFGDIDHLITLVVWCF